jgi:hypothetical protein
MARAERENWVIVEPKPNELQIDLDGFRAIRAYGLQYDILSKAGITTRWKERTSPSMSRNHIHITITLPSPIDNYKRVMLQALLGSDIKREAFNLCRVVNKNKYPIVFFERGNDIAGSAKKSTKIR